MAQMKFLLAKAQKNMALILVAEFAAIGWILFFQTPQFRSDRPVPSCSVTCIKFGPSNKSERMNADRIKMERTILLNSEFEMAAHNLSDLMMEIQTKQRDLNALEAKYRDQISVGPRSPDGK